MTTSMMVPDWLLSLWTTPHTYDLPNWFTLAFSVVFWPLLLIWWHRRRANSVGDLEVIWAPFPAPAIFDVEDFGIVPRSSAFGVMEVKKSNYARTDKELEES